MTKCVSIHDRSVQKVAQKAKKRILRAVKKSAEELRKIHAAVDDPVELDKIVDDILAEVIRELEYTYYVFNASSLKTVLDKLGRQLIHYQDGCAVVLK
jgi:fructose-1,6-bisphosphatase/inositol monophosphatase family enzyme